MFQGIAAQASGTGDILVNANGGNPVIIFAQSNGGNVTVNGNGSDIGLAGLGNALGAATTGSGNTVVNLTAGSVSAGGMIASAVSATHGAGSGNVTVDIAAGVTVAASSNNSATALTMTNSGTGTATATVLGTLSATLTTTGNGTAARYNGTLNIGNGGTTGTLVGDASCWTVNSVIKFNRSNNAAYGEAIHGPGSFSNRTAPAH